MTGRPPLNTGVAYAAGENRQRIRRLEAVRPMAAPGGDCTIGYEYQNGIWSSDGTDLDAAGIFSGSSIAYACGMGTPAAPTTPAVENTLVVGTCSYSVIDTAGMETVNGIRLIPTWLVPDFLDGPCINGFRHVIGHGSISRPHASGNLAYGRGPAVSFDLVANYYDMQVRMMYDYQEAYGGETTLDGPEFTNVPWVWRENDEIAACWHCFVNFDCGE